MKLQALALVGLLAWVFVPIASFAAPPEHPSAPVTVVNDAMDPVPVTLESGASIGVDGEVSVGGSVTVEPGEDPIPVLSDENGVEIVQEEMRGFYDCTRENGEEGFCLGGGGFNGQFFTLPYTVPDGKILVIDAVSMENRVVSSSTWRGAAFLVTAERGTSVDEKYFVGSMEEPIVRSSTRDIYYASQGGLGIRVPSENPVQGFCWSSNMSRFKGESISCRISLSGRLFDE
jgi:hypothetical protein